MDFHFNKVEGQDGILDFHRFVLLFNHSFSPRIRFVGELELEHAFVEGLEEAGEIELEQAYLDFLVSRAFNVRAGMMLVPVGIINERHEPPVYNGVERPFVDTVIVPTTWFEVGAGVHGELGRGFRYRAFVMAPLNALEFDAEEGIRGGRQKGSEANVRNVALTGRAEYLGVPGLTLGASFWTGDSSFAIPRLDTTVRVGEVDARYQRERLELRTQFAHVTVKDAGSAERRAAAPDRRRIRSNDTSHGFRIVGTETSIAIPKRGKGEASIRVRLDQPGTYTFECNRMCGAGHNFMRGEIVVRERSTAGAR
jgi:hypothetical protein